MTISNIRDHPYHFEQALQQQSINNNLDYNRTTTTSTTTTNNNFTWLVFINAKWVPFASSNQYKLEQTLGLGGTFVDIQDRLFPAVKRVRVFPKANYLSYLGVKYRLSRVMQPHYEINDRYYVILGGDEEVFIRDDHESLFSSSSSSSSSVKKNDLLSSLSLSPNNEFVLTPLVLGGSSSSSSSPSNSNMNNNSSSIESTKQQTRPMTSRVS